MAEKHPRGWLWTDDEKKLLPGLGVVVSKVEQAQSDAVRLAKAFPKAAEEILVVIRAYRLCAEPLIKVWSCCEAAYFPCSPETVSLALENVREEEKSWRQLVVRGDIRMEAKKLDGAQLSALKMMNSPGFKEKIDFLVKRYAAKSVDGTINGSAKAVFGDPRLRPWVARLLATQFVRYACEDNALMASQLREFLGRKPAPTMDDVALEVGLNLFRESVTHPGFTNRSPSDAIRTLMADAAYALGRTMRKWADEGKTPGDIAQDNFEILGFDYSLEAQPR